MGNFAKNLNLDKRVLPSVLPPSSGLNDPLHERHH